MCHLSIASKIPTVICKESERSVIQLGLFPFQLSIIIVDVIYGYSGVKMSVV